GLEEFEIGTHISAKIVDATPDDEWFELDTSMAIIPANAQFIRVKAVLNQRNFDNGVVYFDNLSLVKVIPEPGTFGLFALGTALLFFRSRRARA
ncbi:MAG: PEP-CTERM sorting domain-containing protein, partial [Verrucomicrobiota bacterium]